MRISTLFIICLLFILALSWHPVQNRVPAGFALQDESSTGNSLPIYQPSFASNAVTSEVHSAGIVELTNGDIRAVWYGGTEEGHSDVAIYTNVWNSSRRQWGQEEIVFTLETTRSNSRRYARKLGNPVIARGSDSNLWLFYVSAVGGWATSSINLSISKDEGKTWEQAKRLITSPAFNFSTLVKGNPIRFKDGTIGLPVYHEFLAKFGELLRLDRDGNVVDKTRLAWGRDSLQPVIMPYSDQEALSMLRYAGDSPNRILAQYSSSSGLSWPEPFKTDLPNPNAAIAGISINGGKRMLLIFNDHPEERDKLSLAISENQGESWTTIHVFEEWQKEREGKKQGYSYPSLIQTTSGDFHLVYSWNVQKIKHIHFNQAWLESKIP
jgi:predicted neuraminidase